MEKKSFKVGDVVRYADGWYTEAEKDFRLVVVEWFSDVNRGYVVNPKEKYFCGFRKEAVDGEMIAPASADDAAALLRYMHENGIR